MDAVTHALWQVETEKYLARSIFDMLEEQARDVAVAIDLTSQDLPLESKQRLQLNALRLVLNVVLSISTLIKEPNFNGYILAAFEGEEKEDAYMSLLKATGDAAFADITSISVSPAMSVTPIRTPDDEGGGSDSTQIRIIVGVVLGCIAVVGLAVIFVST